MAAYPFHFLFPRVRFSIPHKRKALISSTRLTAIPEIIWQTNFTDRVSLPVYVNYLFNRLLAPAYEYRFLTTAERMQFINEHCDREIIDAYSKLQIGAAQADLWRVIALYHYGGVYMDIDAHQVWPLSFVIGSDTQELYLKIKTNEITNYFIASAPKNKNLKLIIDKICENVRLGNLTNVYDISGPGVFNLVLKKDSVPTRDYKITCNQGNFTNEYFQYIDKPQGKWTKEQQKVDVIRRD